MHVKVLVSLSSVTSLFMYSITVTVSGYFYPNANLLPPPPTPVPPSLVSGWWVLCFGGDEPSRWWCATGLRTLHSGKTSVVADFVCDIAHLVHFLLARLSHALGLVMMRWVGDKKHLGSPQERGVQIHVTAVVVFLLL